MTQLPLDRTLPALRSQVAEIIAFGLVNDAILKSDWETKQLGLVGQPTEYAELVGVIQATEVDFRKRFNPTKLAVTMESLLIYEPPP